MEKFNPIMNFSKEVSDYIRTSKIKTVQKPINKINAEGLQTEPLSIDTERISTALNDKTIKFASIISHYDSVGTMVFGCVPDDYVVKKRNFVKGYTAICRFGPKKGQTISYPDKWEEEKYLLPHYHIDKLWTGGKGTGTAAVQSVLLESLNNEKTIGRITLDATCIDGKTSPAGFYYKLGFRFNNPALNETMEEWMEKGAKREDSPFITGIMHLPKENIEHCLNYGKK